MQLARENKIILSENDFNTISRNIEKHFGISFHFEKKDDLNRVLTEAFLKSNFQREADLISILKSDKLSEKFIDWFIPFVTIGETYFFREMMAIDLLFDKILIDLLKKQDKVRLWSAACSTGEEPYTIAILMKERFPQYFDKISIYGTDINQHFIDKAKAGIYRDWSFRNTPNNIRDKYFRKFGKEYKISDEIKNKVQFFKLNLVEDNFTGIFGESSAFDIVLLRNLLIYFTHETSEKVLSNSSRILKEGGYLIPGLAEAMLIDLDCLEPAPFEKIRFFRKNSSYIRAERDSTLEQIKNIEEKQKKSIATIKRRKNISKKIKSKNTEVVRSTKKNSKIDYNSLINIFNSGEYDLFILNVEKLKESGEYANLSLEKRSNLNILYCKAFANMGDIEKAIQICESSLANEKLNADLHELAAQLFAEFGKYDKALKYLDAAIFIRPNAPMLHFLRSNIYSKTGSISKAKKELGVVIELLKQLNPEEIINEADGLTAGGLKQISESLLNNLN